MKIKDKIDTFLGEAVKLKTYREFADELNVLVKKAEVFGLDIEKNLKRIENLKIEDMKSYEYNALDRTIAKLKKAIDVVYAIDEL